MVYFCFQEKGLVRQQLDSFDEFIQNTMQEIVDEMSEISLTPENQHIPGQGIVPVRYFSFSKSSHTHTYTPQGLELFSPFLFPAPLSDQLRADLAEQTDCFRSGRQYSTTVSQRSSVARPYVRHLNRQLLFCLLSFAFFFFFFGFLGVALTQFSGTHRLCM
jgi:hypothetical protein